MLKLVLLIIIIIIILITIRLDNIDNFENELNNKKVLLFGSSNGLGKVMKEELEKKNLDIITVGKSEKNKIIFDFRDDLILLYHNKFYNLIFDHF
jgi:5,10-methylene-tetrahydrofolate dehydrogenase/methenyl tetrahydrofolate cyclohydrolase